MTTVRRLDRPDGVLRGWSVLVVEDDFILLTELEAVLQDAGADAVHACRNIREAMVLLDKRSVSAAILDIRVGHDSVAPVARKLARCGIPFVFYTGQLSNDRIISQWPDHLVLSKPSHPQTIVRTLAHLVLHEPDLPRRSAS